MKAKNKRPSRRRLHFTLEMPRDMAEAIETFGAYCVKEPHRVSWSNRFDIGLLWLAATALLDVRKSAQRFIAFQCWATAEGFDYACRQDVAGRQIAAQVRLWLRHPSISRHA